MKFIQWTDLDAYFNLAVEEYIINCLDSNEKYFLLWQNQNAVVVGKHQNTIEEINTDYVRDHNVQVVRRLSGGGTVYHDLGNLNYSFITNSEEMNLNIKLMAQPIVRALSISGVDVHFSGRNDLIIDNKKISGSAQYLKGKRLLHHGTLLFNSDLDAISQALMVKRDKIESKGIKSVRSRVTNICDYLPNLTIPTFKSNLFKILSEDSVLEEYKFTTHDRASISTLRDEKYSTWEWNYGKSPEYNIQKERLFCEGEISIYLCVKNGIINSLRIYGNFFGDGDIIKIEQSLQNIKLIESDIVSVLSPLDINHYIHGMDAAELAKIIVN